MFLTNVSVTVPVVDGHTVKAYSRNGSRKSRSANLCLNSTWINFLVKYIKLLSRLYFYLFTRHLYCSQQNVVRPRKRKTAHQKDHV